MNIQTFQIRKFISGNEVILYPTLIEINNKKYLIDCGYEETFEEFVVGLINLGVEITDLHAILISHDDIDHLGALTLFKGKNQDLIIYSSSVEKPYISGKLKSERLQQAEDSLSTLSEEYKTWALQFINQLRRIKRIEVDSVLEDKDKIDNEIEVIFTPGHTKGHISFYIPSKRTLIANDAIVIEEGRFEIANPTFTLNLKQAIQSVEKIKGLAAERIICYHGGVAEDNISEKLADLINKYKTTPNRVDGPATCK
jgi:glyoxylase-like metal-dependent hydrolase (beta-lactamase superfamily II)